MQTDQEIRIPKGIFDACLRTRRLLSTRPPITSAVATPAPTVPLANEGGIRPPKIEVLNFDENLMNWKTFCEQHSVLIDSKPGLTDPEKLAYIYMYLCQALKDGEKRR